MFQNIESFETSSHTAVIKNSLTSIPEWDHIEYKLVERDEVVPLRATFRVIGI